MVKKGGSIEENIKESQKSGQKKTLPLKQGLFFKKFEKIIYYY